MAEQAAAVRARTFARNKVNRYVRVDDSPEVWAVTYKVASTSMFAALPQPRNYTELRKGDHVRMVVRDPRDRLVSAWKWFTTAQTSYIKDILEASKPDHDLLMSDKTDFNKWISIALRYWNPHWAPQTEIHPKWRQFELINIADIDKLGWGHQKKTRTSNAWEEYYTPSVLQLVEGIYAEDLEMWEVIKDGINTGTNRIL